MLLITGIQNASESQTQLIDKCTRMLKKKTNVTVVGLAGFNKDAVKLGFQLYVAYSSRTPEILSESELYEMDKVVNKTVNAACASRGKW